MFDLEDDLVHEEQVETFAVEITTNDPAVILGTSSVLVSIADNDGKFRTNVLE